ncbi:MAG: TonB-dependent receptor [Saprospiraceae bacterium]|nr:TonB-dependent receptor [Saprospiraceae bacterium]
MRLKWLLFSSLVILIHSVNGQDSKYTLSGYIKDASNGESLIGATAYLVELGQGVASNEYGFYSISIPEGTYTVEFAYLGLQTIQQQINLDQNQTLNIELTDIATELNQVVVTGEAEDRNVTDIEMSVNKLDMTTIKSIPSLLGEVEVIRSLQLLPGVTTVGEGASGFNVRGGSIDQNLVLLDEAPVFNSAHLFGFFSVFNPDAVKDVKLYKGGIPARYGGRISSILDVRMKEGNTKDFTMNGGVGFIFSRLALEAPIVKDKASFIVAGRRSYIDVLAKPFLNEDLAGSILNFYDLTLKANYNINEKNRVYISGYFGRDNFGFGEAAGFNWGNSTGTIRWNHLFSEKLFSNFTFFYSDYDYKINFGDDASNKFSWNANIENFSFKPEFTYFINPKNILRFGGQSIVYTFEPGNAIGVSEGEFSDVSLDKKHAIESAVYLDMEQDLSPAISLNYGLRLSHFNYTGSGNAYTFAPTIAGKRRTPIDIKTYDQWESIQTYLNLEPRFSLKWQVSPEASIKTSYNRTSQYIHLISNTTASTPVDVWTPSTNNIKPQLGDQVALGYFRNLQNNTYELSTEIYYKKMQNLVDYIDGADLLLNEYLEGDLLSGKGRAYGLEIQAKKNKGHFTGWISYTLARTERLVEGINGDAWYPSRYDQLHNFSISGFYDLSERWSLSGTFVYNTGTPTTFATSRYEQQGYVVPHNANDTRNNVRIPDYNRLDLSATLKGKKKKDNDRWIGDWVFSIYNVYNRRNPFSIYFQQQSERVLADQPTSTQAIKLSVVGSFIPSVSYNFKFQ